MLIFYLECFASMFICLHHIWTKKFLSSRNLVCLWHEGVMVLDLNASQSFTFWRLGPWVMELLEDCWNLKSRAKFERELLGAYSPECVLGSGSLFLFLGLLEREASHYQLFTTMMLCSTIASWSNAVADCEGKAWMLCRSLRSHLPSHSGTKVTPTQSSACSVKWD